MADLVPWPFPLPNRFLDALGYPRVIAFLRGETNRDDLMRRLVQDTRQYAKRQRTWFRHQMDIVWNAS